MSEQAGDYWPNPQYCWGGWQAPYQSFQPIPGTWKIELPKTLKIKKLHPDAKIPTKGYPTDSGMDLYCVEDVELAPDEVKRINIGIAIGFPEGYWGKIQSRSSLAQDGIDVLGGIIDSTYTGPIIVCLHNSNIYCERKYPKGHRIAQLILHELIDFPIEEVAELNDTNRGSKGFGSTN